MITADEASKLSEEKNLSITNQQRIDEEIKGINHWIDIAAKNGYDQSSWFVPENITDTQVEEIVKSFKSRGFEAIDNSGIIRTWKFLW